MPLNQLPSESDTVTVSSDTFISALEVPESFKASSVKYGELLFRFSGVGGYSDFAPPRYQSPFSSYTGLSVAALESGEKVREFTSQGGFKNGFYITRPDKRIIWLDLDVPFWRPDVSTDKRLATYRAGAVAVVSMRVNGEERVSGQYIKGSFGGCGVSDIANVVSIEDVGPLALTGDIRKDGEWKPTIYLPTEEAWSKEYYQKLFDSFKAGRTDATFEQFKKMAPLFFWEDQLGRLIKFTNTDTAPAAECGKPVIYLYPEKTTQVSVKLAPQGGFTKSEPIYVDDGWNVIASRNGSLLNKKDGKVYPYLFWEGRGGLYAEPEKYWVVAKNDVPAFLNASLARFGFTAWRNGAISSARDRR